MIGYVPNAALSQTVTSEADVTGLSVTVTVGASRLIVITGYIPEARLDSASAARANIRIKEGSTALQRWLGSAGVTNNAVSVISPMPQVVLVAPSAGSHTYKITAERDQGAGNLLLASASTYPAYILVLDCGPSS